MQGAGLKSKVQVSGLNSFLCFSPALHLERRIQGLGFKEQ